MQLQTDDWCIIQFDETAGDTLYNYNALYLQVQVSYAADHQCIIHYDNISDTLMQ
jgi:hypothetical protein